MRYHESKLLVQIHQSTHSLLRTPFLGLGASKMEATSSNVFSAVSTKMNYMQPISTRILTMSPRMTSIQWQQYQHRRHRYLLPLQRLIKENPIRDHWHEFSSEPFDCIRRLEWCKISTKHDARDEYGYDGSIGEIWIIFRCYCECGGQMYDTNVSESLANLMVLRPSLWRVVTP